MYYFLAKFFIVIGFIVLFPYYLLFKYYSPLKYKLATSLVFIYHTLTHLTVIFSSLPVFLIVV